MDNTIKSERQRILNEMANCRPETEKYKQLLENFKDLSILESNKNWMNPEIILPELFKLLCIGLIIRHEEFNIITSRAIGMVKFK